MQIGNKCPNLNEYHKFETGYCVQQCDHQCMPASVLYHIENRVKNDKHTGNYISVTSLLGCLRQLYLERTIDYYVEPPKNWWSLRGTILHKILEQPDMSSQIDDMRKYVNKQILDGALDKSAAHAAWLEIETKLADLTALLPSVHIPNWQTETEYEYPIGEIEGQMVYLRGTVDVLRPDTGELIDYKTIGDNGLGVIKDGAKNDHILQFNMYRLLAERGYPVGQKDTYKPVKITKISAYYLTMMQVVKTGGLLSENTIWRVSEPTTHPNMVGNPLLLAEREKMVLKRGKRHINAVPDDYELKQYKKFKLTYAVPDVPLMDLNEVEKIILDNTPILVYAFKDGKMPPMCSPEMRQWKCNNYCPDQIRQACDAHNLTTGEVREVMEDDNGIPVEG